MSVGLLGAMKGLGEGLSDAGQQMAKDAYEAKREQRLEEARMRSEQREEAQRGRLMEMQHGMTLERDEVGHGFNLERDELGHGRALERDELGHGRTLERDDLQHGRTMERDQAQHGRQVSLEHMKEGLLQSRPEKLDYRDGVYFDPHTGEPVQNHRDMLGKTEDAEAGSSDFGATELNHIRGMVSTMFGGSLDAMGNMMLPPENREKGIEVYGRAEALHRNGMPLGQAVYFAYQAVTGMKGEDAAQEAATAEAEAQGMGGWTNRAKRNEFVNRRAQEIFQESQALEPMFDQIMLRPQGLLNSMKDEQPSSGPARIETREQYEMLPSGTEYIAPDGSRRRKP